MAHELNRVMHDVSEASGPRASVEALIQAVSRQVMAMRGDPRGLRELASRLNSECSDIADLVFQKRSSNDSATVGQVSDDSDASESDAAERAAASRGSRSSSGDAAAAPETPTPTSAPTTSSPESPSPSGPRRTGSTTTKAEGDGGSPTPSDGSATPPTTRPSGGTDGA